MPMIRRVRCVCIVIPYQEYYIGVHSNDNSGVHGPLFLFSIKLTEDHYYQCILRSGAIYLDGKSTMQIDDSTVFFNNHAEENGGKKNPELQVPSVSSSESYASPPELQARSNIVHVKGDSDTNVRLPMHFFQ